MSDKELDGLAYAIIRLQSCSKITPSDEDGTDTPIVSGEYFEVIGNIYENPELLV